MLSVKKRQEYLKYLGYYKGAIDGKVGKGTKKAYKDLQNDYFFRTKDKDGLYGKNTDILLQNAYNVKKYAKNFNLKTELSCHCKGKYCTGYPAIYSVNALTYLQDVRDEYGAVSVTSPLRCNNQNKKSGGVTNSAHKKGKAFDIQNAKICLNLTTRKNFIDKFIKKSKSVYAYCNGYGKTKYRTTHPKAPGMGKSVHIQTK